MKTILYIHQSADLYGSDKTLLYLLQNLDRTKYKPIVVIPNNGPLKDELDKLGIKTVISPVLKIVRDQMGFLFLMKFPFLSIHALISLQKKLKGEKINLIQSNTLVVLLGFIYAWVFRKKHIWHVHEIIGEPKIVNKLFAWVFYITSDCVVFNSKNTQESYANDLKKIQRKSKIIYNGLNRDEKKTNKNEQLNLKNNIFNDSDAIVLGLVGRINKWKGQQLLLNAFDKINQEYSHVRLLIIGSTTFSQKNLLDDLNQKISEKGLSQKIVILPFQNNIWKYYDIMDMLIVPSIKPEPFGLVTIEAMLSQKPVIASGHGGITEIVLNNKTGFLFNPNDETDLISKIKYLLNHPEIIEFYGKNGEIVAKEKFGLQQYIENFNSLYKEIL